VLNDEVSVDDDDGIILKPVENVNRLYDDFVGLCDEDEVVEEDDFFFNGIPVQEELETEIAEE
jgi:hypothetical protein